MLCQRRIFQLIFFHFQWTDAFTSLHPALLPVQIRSSLLPSHHRRVRDCWKRTAEDMAGHESHGPSTHLKQSFAGRSLPVCPLHHGEGAPSLFPPHRRMPGATAFSLDLTFLNYDLKPSTFGTCMAIFVCFKDVPVRAGVYAQLGCEQSRTWHMF